VHLRAATPSILHHAARAVANAFLIGTRAQRSHTHAHCWCPTRTSQVKSQHHCTDRQQQCTNPPTYQQSVRQQLRQTYM
jgi:hypothetical protein